MAEDNNHAEVREQRYFSPETREKLAAAARARWARVRAEGVNTLADLNEHVREKPLSTLASAVVELLDAEEFEPLRNRIAEQVDVQALVGALEDYHGKGTSLQITVRRILEDELLRCINMRRRTD